jgi:hypothetical protein
MVQLRLNLNDSTFLRLLERALAEGRTTPQLAAWLLEQAAAPPPSGGAVDYLAGKCYDGASFRATKYNRPGGDT